MHISHGRRPEIGGSEVLNSNPDNTQHFFMFLRVSFYFYTNFLNRDYIFAVYIEYILTDCNSLAGLG